MTKSVKSVIVGDTIRFSAALLRQIYEQPEHITVLVTVTEIREWPNGSKMLVLQVSDAPDA